MVSGAVKGAALGVFGRKGNLGLAVGSVTWADFTLFPRDMSSVVDLKNHISVDANMQTRS